MKNFINAVLVGLVVGIVVAIICHVLAVIPFLSILGTWGNWIGLIAGLIAFARRWDFNF